MSRIRLSWALIFLLGMLVWTTAFAQPQISGPQSGTLGPGTYLVVGDIQVRPGTTLTIVPGTTFLHNGHWFWWIYGQFTADGTETDSIQFTWQQAVPEHRWGGLRFMAGASAGIVDYCVIEHAVIASGTPSTQKGGGIFSDGIPLTVTHSRISNNDAYWGGGGMYIQNAANLLVDHCVIAENTATLGANGGGIYLYYCTGATISYNVIARNSATGT